MLVAKLRTALVSSALLLAGGFVAAQPPFSNAKIRAEINDTQKYLVKTWRAILGSRFEPPRIVYYSSPMKTGCGPVELGNAFFCRADNKIYIDTGFIKMVDKQAFEKLKSPGNYAGLTAVAHEFGHAVNYHTSVPVLARSEGAADCFAGAASHFAIADGQFPDYAFDEALFLMELGGDDTVHGYDPNNIHQMIFVWALTDTSHGDVEQRQAAFLRGFYGGPNFCISSPGVIVTPPAGHQVLASRSLLFSPSATSNHNCSVSTSAAGSRVRNIGTRGDCVMNLLPADTLLPDHLRIEVTVKLLPKPAGRQGALGIYYGDNRSTDRLVRFGYGTPDGTDANVSKIDGAPPVAEPVLTGGGFFNEIPQPASGEKRLTLDIHHQGKNVYFVEYINGTAIGHNGMWKHGTRFQRLNVPEFGLASDEAGLWVREPGTEAIFSNFRVTALYR